MCEVVNITNHPPGVYHHDIYIGYAASWGEAGKWSNQFDVAKDLYLEARDLRQDMPIGNMLDIDYAVLLYRDWLLNTIGGLRLQEDIDELRGKVLGCFCKPHPCHGDVLVELLGQREEVPNEQES